MCHPYNRRLSEGRRPAEGSGSPTRRARVHASTVSNHPLARAAAHSLGDHRPSSIGGGGDSVPQRGGLSTSVKFPTPAPDSRGSPRILSTYRPPNGWLSEKSPAFRNKAISGAGRRIRGKDVIVALGGAQRLARLVTGYRVGRPATILHATWRPSGHRFLCPRPSDRPGSSPGEIP